MNISSIIIDDEANNVANLIVLLNSYCPVVELLATANSAEQGKTLIRKHRPDLVFLDIQMPVKSGLDLLKELDEIAFEIIFVTAYNEFVIHDMKFSAVDYLLKPIDVAELQSAVDWARKRVGLKVQNDHLANLVSLLQKQQSKNEHRIALTTLKETRFVKTDEIVRCESSNNYSTFYLSNDERIVVSKPIYEYEQVLTGYGFMRCSQSHIINILFVKSWVKESGGYILMKDGKQVPIARNKKDELKLFLKMVYS